MSKIILSIFFCSASLYAGLVNGIAIIVNETPITLYDIDKEVETKKVSKEQAVSSIIDKILYDQEIEKHRISIDIFDIDNYIGKLAANNKMNVLDFKSLVRQQQNYELFKENIKKQLLHQKLITKIAGGKLKIASEEDLKIYYKNNKEQFKIADTINLIAYRSKSKQALTNLKKNPMLQSSNISIQNITMKQNELNAQTKYIINSTSEKEFSAIFAQKKNYNMFFIKEKKDTTILLFDDVKDQIFQVIMKKREQDYLKEYFETAKITADIKVLR
jgi:hypothetical protein